MSNTKTFLHVGCGPNYKDMTTPGFASEDWQELRCDIDESVKPDIISSALDLGVIDSESFDAIYSSHNIEHLYPHEVGLALTEFKRVLNPTGFVVITCPDLQSVAALIAKDKLLEPVGQAEYGRNRGRNLYQQPGDHDIDAGHPYDFALL